MTLPQSLHAYAAEAEIFDRVLASNTGTIRVSVGQRGQANHLRARLHQARALDRRENFRSAPEGVMAGHSVWDPIVVTIREDTGGEFWLYLEKTHAMYGAVEEVTNAQ